MANVVSAWSNYLAEEIDDKIGNIRREHARTLDMCEVRVVADVIAGAAIEDEWNKYILAENDYQLAKVEYEKVVAKLRAARRVVVSELDLPDWGIDRDRHLSKVIAAKHGTAVDAMFLATPEGEEIAELRNIRRNLEHKLQVASASKRLASAIQQICEAAGIELDVSAED